LESIVTQKTNFPFEIIVGDDASTDPLSRDILNEYARRYPDLIVPIQRETNIGPWKSFLDLMRRARGEYIAHCDGDDMMLPGKLQKQADFLDANPNFSMVGHDILIMRPDGQKMLHKAGFGKKILIVDDLLTYGIVPFTNSAAMSRKKYQTVWDSEKNIIDYLIYIDRAINGPVGVINEPLGIYRADIGIYHNKKRDIELAFEYSRDFALDRGCDPMSIFIGCVKTNEFRSILKLSRNPVVLKAFQNFDPGKIPVNFSLKTKTGMNVFHLLRKWPSWITGFAILWEIVARPPIVIMGIFRKAKRILNQK